MRRLRPACLLLAALCTVAAAAQPASPPVSRLDALRPRLWSKDKAERQKAYDAYLAEGDEGRKRLAADLLAVRTAAVAACRELYLSDQTQKKLLNAHKKMADARKEALRVIFDREIYPDANHGRSGQPVVDRAVSRVKAYYPLYRKAFDPVLKRFARVARACERIQEIDGVLERLEVEGVEFNPPLEKLVNCDPSLLGILREELAFLSFRERVLRYNRLIRTTATAAERKVVEITNQYRMQLGLKPLAISEPLTQAARKHSLEMQRLGYFGHESPAPANRTPQQRCLNEGYRHFRGENCAMGPPTPRGAFSGWYNSSGHHRNMLGGHNEIGVGRAGALWTEDFGNRPDLDLDNPPRTLPAKPSGKK